MSLDLFMMAFQAGEPRCVDAAAVRRVLEHSKHEAIAGEECYAVTASDGCQLELDVNGLASGELGGCGLALRGINEELAGFILDFALAGDFVILVAGGGDVPPLLPRREVAEHLPPDMVAAVGEPVVCASSAEMLEALTAPVEEWRNYRDRVIGAPPDAPSSRRDADE